MGNLAKRELKQLVFGVADDLTAAPVHVQPLPHGNFL